MVPSSPTVCYGALDPPVGGTFHFENLIMPPLPKTCPKMVLSDKGGSLCVKDVFAKKFFGAGRDSAGGALASVRHNLQYNGSLKCSAFNRRAASSRTGFVMGLLDDHARKLDMRQTGAKGAAKDWAQRTRALVKDGKTWEQAAVIAAKQVFPSEFDPLRYRREGLSIEALVEAIENLAN